MNKFYLFFYFIVGLLSAFCVKLLGLITIGEIIVILYSLWCVISGRLKWKVTSFDKMTRKIIWLLLLASFSCVITNVLCNSLISDILKGLGTISLLAFSFLFFKKMLFDRYEYIIPFLFGYGLSTIIVNLYFIQFSDLIVGERGLDMDFFREEMYAYIICNMAFFLNGYLYSKSKKILLISNLVLAFICLFGNSRTNFLMLIITDFFLLLNYNITIRGIHYTMMTLSKWFFFLCLLLFLSYFSYSYLASNGYLGKGAQQKYEMQSHNKGGILSARSYIVRGFITISKHPLGGVGTKHQVDDNIQIRRDFAKVTHSRFRSWDNNIMSHTAVFDWWIAYGFLTFPFWVYVLLLAIKGLMCAVKSNHPLVALVIFSTLILLWNMFNSPFGGRVQYGFSIMLVIYIICNNSISINENEKVKNYRRNRLQSQR